MLLRAHDTMMLKTHSNPTLTMIFVKVFSHSDYLAMQSEQRCPELLFLLVSATLLTTRSRASVCGLLGVTMTWHDCTTPRVASVPKTKAISAPTREAETPDGIKSLR